MDICKHAASITARVVRGRFDAVVEDLQAHSHTDMSLCFLGGVEFNDGQSKGYVAIGLSCDHTTRA